MNNNYAQLYYEDVKIGDGIPSLTKHPTRRQLVMWAGASQEFSEMHYDDKFAADHGFPGVIVFGMLNNSFLAQMVLDWAGPNSMIRRFKSSNRQFVLVEKDEVCSGTVCGKREQDGMRLVDCEVKLSCEGQECVFGEITVEMPSKGPM